MKITRRILAGFLFVGLLLGIAYLAYSGWYSLRIFAEGPRAFLSRTLQESNGCVDGVPVASAAGIELDRTFQWVWAPLPQLPTFRSFQNAPSAREMVRRVPNQPNRNQVIIQFTEAARSADRRAYLQLINGEIERSLSRIDTYVVRINGDIPETFPSSPYVLRVERDYYAGITATNDPFFAQQWALPYLGVEAIWATLPNIADDMETVHVAVIDSGVCIDHPDLEGRIGEGWDFVENDRTPQDDMGHGCGVAGVIAANIDNNIGVTGVAPFVEIMPLRVLDKKGLGTQSDIAAAIVFAADRKADIINLSLAGPNPSDALQDAITYADAKGVIVIAAAGNNGSEGAWYPAAYNSVVSVGAIDANSERSSFSNYGTNVDIYAPGRDIYTTNRDGEYQNMTGTSFAAPIVSGLTALDILIQGENAIETSQNIEPPVFTNNCQ